MANCFPKRTLECKGWKLLENSQAETRHFWFLSYCGSGGGGSGGQARGAGSPEPGRAPLGVRRPPISSDCHTPAPRPRPTPGNLQRGWIPRAARSRRGYQWLDLRLPAGLATRRPGPISQPLWRHSRGVVRVGDTHTHRDLLQKSLSYLILHLGSGERSRFPALVKLH